MTGHAAMGTDADCPAACLTPAADWDPRISQIHDYWLLLRQRVAAETGNPASLPGRQHLDPIDIPHLLPLMRLVDVERAPLRFRYRLIGTHEAAIYGEHTGRWVDEVFPAFKQPSPMRDDIVAAAEHGRPCYYRGAPRLGTVPEVEQVERIILPLARDGSEVDILLFLFVRKLKMMPRR
jgi:hypothetical protein